MTTSQQTLLQAAVRNNAEWCAAMSRTHDLAGEFGAEAWTAPRRTPLYYPDAVTLTPGADPVALVARIDTSAPGATVKDSFADLDLTASGWSVLFDAQWVHRPAGPSPHAPEGTWDVVKDAGALGDWARAWAGEESGTALFRPELLEEPGVFVLAGRTPEGRVTAGATVRHGADVLGVSNVFAHTGGPGAAWPGIVAAAHDLFPGTPLVGYEHGADLTAALDHGFTPIGPLRIWMRP